MRGVENNHTSISIYLVLKRVLFWFPKKAAKWDPFSFSLPGPPLPSHLQLACEPVVPSK